MPDTWLFPNATHQPCLALPASSPLRLLPAFCVEWLLCYCATTPATCEPPRLATKFACGVSVLWNNQCNAFFFLMPTVGHLFSPSCARGLTQLFFFLCGALSDTPFPPFRTTVCRPGRSSATRTVCGQCFLRHSCLARCRVPSVPRARLLWFCLALHDFGAAAPRMSAWLPIFDGLLWSCVSSTWNFRTCPS